MRILFIIALALSACGRPEPNAYVKDFKENEQKFNNIIQYLNKEYLKNPVYENEIRIEFLNCDKYKDLGDYKCDDTLIEFMNEIGLRSIRAENENNDEFVFDMVYFTIGMNTNVEYIYNPWEGDESDYKDEKVEFKSINKHWTVKINNINGP